MTTTTISPGPTKRARDGVLVERPRPGGGVLRVVLEQVADREVVRLIHVSQSGGIIHAFVIDPAEAPAVAAALEEVTS
jgi:hypothetical protein